MRAISLLLLLSLAQAGFTQSRFEGTIRYRATSKDSSIALDIESLFRNDRIRFTFEVLKAPMGGAGKKEDIILDFSSGLINRINHADSTVEQEPMTGSQKKQDITSLVAGEEHRQILGYPATLYLSPSLDKDIRKDSITMHASGQIGVWFADSLFFPVPDSMRYVQMVPLFTNGHVALASSIRLAVGAINLQLLTEARSVTPGSIPAAAMAYPAAYRVKTH